MPGVRQRRGNNAQGGMAARPGQGGAPQVRVRMIRINIKLLLQLLVLGLIVYQVFRQYYATMSFFEKLDASPGAAKFESDLSNA